MLTVFARLISSRDTAANMRAEADDFETRAKDAFTSTLKRIESVLEGI